MSTSGPSSASDRKPSLSPVARWELPPTDSSDDDAWVCLDGLELGPAIVDRKEGMSR